MAEINVKKIIEAKDYCTPECVWLIGENLVSKVRSLRDPHGHTMWTAGRDAIERSPGMLLGKQIIVKEETDLFAYGMIDPEGELVILRKIEIT